MKTKVTVSLGAVIGLALVSAAAYISTADIVPDRNRTKAGVEVVFETVFLPSDSAEKEAWHE